MIITISGANFSASNIGTLSTWTVSKSIGAGAEHSIPSYVDKNSAFNYTITLKDGYTFGTYSVTMGGQTITPTVTETSMTINIASVTGAIRIEVKTINSSTGEEDKPVTPEQPGTGGGSGTPELVTVYFANKDFTAPGKDDGTGVRFDQKISFDNVPNTDVSVTVSLTSNSGNLTGKKFSMFGNGDNTQKIGDITVGGTATVTLKAGWDKIWFFDSNVYLTQAETLHLEVVGDVLVYPDNDAVVIYEGTITQTNSKGDAAGTRLDQKIKFSEALSEDTTIKVYVTSFGTWTGKTATVYANADSTRNFGNITFDSGLPKEISLKAGDTGLWFFNAGLKAIEPEKLGIRVVLK